MKDQRNHATSEANRMTSDLMNIRQATGLNRVEARKLWEANHRSVEAAIRAFQLSK